MPVEQTCSGVPGQVCQGTNGYVSYEPGDLPVVISVPHGGSMTPASIPDRTGGTTVTDTNTIELGRAVSDALRARTGRAPHLVICHLRRTKLDANREVLEAAEGRPEAVRAWTEYHAFIERATSDAVARSGGGFYLDLHGHGHPIARLELGYLLPASTLSRSDAALDADGSAAASSLARLVGRGPAPFSEMLRGPSSLGGLLAPAVPSVPSPAAPSPGADPYFDGGYSTARHTTSMPGVQIESHFPGVRDSAPNRAAFGAALAEALVAYLGTHAGLQIGAR
jgi:hypothetical protein